jgi:four helix bundle protein
MTPITHPLPGRLWVVRIAEEIGSRVKRQIAAWPQYERERLGDQLFRAVDSIGANISEGHVRVHVKERLHFFSIAQGSLEEALFHLRRARDRGLVTRLEAFTVSGLLIRLSKGLEHLSEKQTIR